MTSRFWRAAARFVSGFVMLAAIGAAFVVPARADAVRIVAIGASNTAGSGVGYAASWPGQLEAMLRAKGYDVALSVQGVVGDTSAGILQRVASVPAGTRVVIFDIGKGNDLDRGSEGQSAANRQLIEQKIRALGAKPVFAAYARIVGSEQSNPSAWVSGDAHHHLTPQSHARVAAALLPQVVAAIGKR